MKTIAGWVTIFWLLVAICSAPTSGQGASRGASNQDVTAAKPAKAKSSRSPKKSKAGEQASKSNRPQNSAKSEASESPSDAEIATARSGGKVWVNLDSGIYHKTGRWYGKTKNGKFMSEAEAKAAGYKASQRN